MAKYQNLKYDNWTLEHTRKQKFELKGRVVELPEEIGDLYPKLLKKIDEKVVTNDNKIEPKEDEKVVMNVEESKEELPLMEEPIEEKVVEEPVKEKKSRKKSKN